MQIFSKHPAFVAARQARWLTVWAAACFGVGVLHFAAQRHGLGLDASALPLVLRGSLPSFVHTYVFVLLACVWLARTWPQALGLGLLFWWVDVLIELLQRPALHARWGTGDLLRGGLVSTFDWNDLVAVSLGLLAAWGTLAWAQMPHRPGVRA